MRTRHNAWHIDVAEDGCEYEATFDREDFESWFLAGASRGDRFTARHQRELYENCTYLAQAEARRMTQTPDELKSAIRQWADDWNATAKAEGSQL